MLPASWRPTRLAPEPAASARAAGLRYVSDARPGLRRERTAGGFEYFDEKGDRVRDEDVLERIQQLAIPPAWKDVWICPRPDGHLQASGRDARGRKQYKYHRRWREVRDDVKYERMVAFAKALPTIRAQVEKDLVRPGLPREKVLATVVRLLEMTFIRVGNGEYARSNRSFGLTTMRDRHVLIEGGRLRFRFRGKAGKKLSIELQDRRLARIVKRCRDIPGYELFQYVDDEGGFLTIDAADVNAYLRGVSGKDFTAKDFRTWGGTLLMFTALQEMQGAGTQKEVRSRIQRAVESVAERLGNTPAVCRKCYIHPAVIEAFLDGTMASVLQQRIPVEPGLPPEETAVLRLVERRLPKASCVPRLRYKDPEMSRK